MLNVFQTKWFCLCVCSAICKPHHLLFHGWEDTLRFGNSLLLPSQLNSVERKKQFSNFNLNHLFIVLKGFHYLVEKQSNSWTDMTAVTSYQFEITIETMYMAVYIYIYKTNKQTKYIYIYICVYRGISTIWINDPKPEGQQGKVFCPAFGSHPPLCSTRGHVEGWLESYLVEKDLWVLVRQELKMSQCMPRWPRRPEPSWPVRKVLWLTRPEKWSSPFIGHLESCVHFWAQGRHWGAGMYPEKGNRAGESLKNDFSEE